MRLSLMLLIRKANKLQDEFVTLNDKKKFSIFKENTNSLLFKLKESYDKIMSTHETIHNTTFLFDKKYHGPFREEIGGAFFNESRRKIVYEFESYLLR